MASDSPTKMDTPEKGTLEAPPPYDASQMLAPKPRSPLQPRGPFPLNLPALNAARNKRTILASASPRRRQLLGQIGLTNIEIIPSTFAENIPKEGLSPFEYVLQTATAKALAVYRSELEASVAARNTAGGVNWKGDPELIIAADTVVVGANGMILEKPRSERQHVDMLKNLRDGGRGRRGGPEDVKATVDGFESLGLGGGMRGENVMTQSGTGEQKYNAWHKVYTAVAVLAPLESAKDPGYALETSVEETSVKFDATVTDDMIMAYVRTREGADKAGGYGIQGIGSLLVERIDGTFDNVVGLPLRVTLGLIEKVLQTAQDEDAASDELDEEDDQ